MFQYAYDRLNSLDSYFLFAENRTTHMHVGGIAIYDAGSLRKPDGGIDVDRIRDYIGSKLDRLPRYRQTIRYTPIEHQPIWVDDPHFNIQYHIRHGALPRPGDEEQLKLLSGRIMSQQLDREKPLWELLIVEGLEGGDRFALVSKIHHAMVDGISTVDLLTEILTPEPTRAFTKAGTWVPRPAPSRWELFRAEMLRRARVPLDAALRLRETVARAEDLRSNLQTMARAAGDVLRKSVRRVSSTPLNQPIGPHRRFDWLRIDLAELKAVRRALGGSVNDIVLATVTGGVRRYLERHGADVSAVKFRVMTPVSVRTDGERGTLGNRVSAWMVDLPVSESDPRQCVARIRETTERLKESNQALGADLLARAMSWTPSTLLATSSRLATRALPINLVVTNVPGPQQPLYLLGSRMLENYGVIPLIDHTGLGIVVFSYAGTLSFGFTGDWDTVPDLHEFAQAIRDAFRELCRASEPLSGERPGARAEPASPR
jgi:diacylglycerol O-acyltransferase / wax synthase